MVGSEHARGCRVQDTCDRDIVVEEHLKETSGVRHGQGRGDDVRLQAGKPSLGFLNPLLYANAAALNDVTTGSSSGCGFSGGGWPATAGWDAVTGLGTPNFAALSKIVAALP